MTIQIELSAETGTLLTAAAEARGIALEQYAQDVLQEATAAMVMPRSRASQDVFRAFLDEIARQVPGAPDTSHLNAETFSRAAIYGEHD